MWERDRWWRGAALSDMPGGGSTANPPLLASTVYRVLFSNYCATGYNVQSVTLLRKAVCELHFVYTSYLKLSDTIVCACSSA